MKSCLTARGILGLTLLLFAIAFCFAAVPQANAQAPAAKSAKASAPAAKGDVDAKASSAEEAQQRAKIMASPEWKQVSTEYSKWLSTQAIYTPADVQRISDEVATQFQTMPTSELQGYLDDWQAKLAVLNGKDFQEAQNWLGAYMAPTTAGSRRMTLKQLGLTDVAKMTAAQLDDAILRIRATELQVQQSQSAYAQSQQQMVSMVQRNYGGSQGAQPQNGGSSRYGSGPGYNTLQSPYRPPKYNPPPDPQPQFYVNGYGRVGYMLPF